MKERINNDNNRKGLRDPFCPPTIPQNASRTMIERNRVDSLEQRDITTTKRYSTTAIPPPPPLWDPLLISRQRQSRNFLVLLLLLLSLYLHYYFLNFYSPFSLSRKYKYVYNICVHIAKILPSSMLTLLLLCLILLLLFRCFLSKELIEFFLFTFFFRQYCLRRRIYGERLLVSHLSIHMP